MKAFHHHLSSGDHRRATAALALLAAVASRGPAPAAELVRGFDFDLKALSKLARPPKCESILAGLAGQARTLVGGFLMRLLSRSTCTSGGTLTRQPLRGSFFTAPAFSGSDKVFVRCSRRRCSARCGRLAECDVKCCQECMFAASACSELDPAGNGCREREGAKPGAGATWRSKDPTKRPSCALVVGFALALLNAADAPLLATLVAVRCGTASATGVHMRGLSAGLLQNAGSHPLIDYSMAGFSIAN